MIYDTEHFNVPPEYCDYKNYDYVEITVSHKGMIITTTLIVKKSLPSIFRKFIILRESYKALRYTGILNG